MLRKRHKYRKYEADSIDATPRDGAAARSSDEVFVMRMERRSNRYQSEA